jgi:hypothetical protein
LHNEISQPSYQVNQRSIIQKKLDIFFKIDELGIFRRLNYENECNKKYHVALVVAGLSKGACQRDLTSLRA